MTNLLTVNGQFNDLMNMVKIDLKKNNAPWAKDKWPWDNLGTAKEIGEIIKNEFDWNESHPDDRHNHIKIPITKRLYEYIMDGRQAWFSSIFEEAIGIDIDIEDYSIESYEVPFKLYYHANPYEIEVRFDESHMVYIEYD